MAATDNTSIKGNWTAGDLQFVRNSDGQEVARIGGDYLLPKIKKIAIEADFDNSEQDSGWTIPANAVVVDAFVEVTTGDSGETLDVGTNGSGSNDPDGFLDGVSVATQGIVKGTLASGGQTKGALLRADESGAGVLVPEVDVTSGGETLTYTGSAVTNTMRGAIYVVYFELA